MQAVKENYVGAVTMVGFSQSGELLYVGMGAEFMIYDVSSGTKLLAQPVLANGTLHGMELVDTFGALFGQKKLVVFKNLPQHAWQLADLSDASCHLQQVGRQRQFDDWIFDCRFLTRDQDAMESPPLAVGLAHNFVQLWDPVQDRISRSVQCSERCILYSLAFHGRSWQQLIVASGTVYQQILLWKPSQKQEQQEENRDVLAQPQQRLHGHDGVIFKLKWSNDGSLLASVSDDRTVQLWSWRDADQFQANQVDQQSEAMDAVALLPSTRKTAQLLEQLQALDCCCAMNDDNDTIKSFHSVFRGWGHTARVWDVQFSAFGLVSVSEDSECKLWDFSGTCVATLQGHVGKHVWCVAVHPNTKMIATGGGDASVKVWDAMHQIVCTAPNSTRSCRDIGLVPACQQHEHVPINSNDHHNVQQQAITTKKNKQAKSHKKNAMLSIRDIALDQQAARAFVAMENGKMAQVDLTASTSSCGDSTTLLDLTENNGVPVVKGSISCIELDAFQQNVVVGDTSGWIHIVQTSCKRVRVSLQAHRTRIFKIWCVSASDDTDNKQTIFTCSIDGVFKEWNCSFNETDDDAHTKLELVATYQSPRKSSTCCLLPITTRGGHHVLMGGDGRGNVYLFNRVVPSCCSGHDQDQEQVREATSGVWNVHGRDHVSCILQDSEKGIIMTGGHDGYLCSFIVEEDQDTEQGAGDDTATDGSCVRLKLIGRTSIKGLATVKQIWLEHSELFVFGFHSTQAILHNLTAEYRVMTVDCGGWRRPHAFAMGFNNSQTTALPWHTLVFASTLSATWTGSNVHQPCLAVHSWPKSVSLPALSFSHCSINTQLHGRMITSVCWLPCPSSTHPQLLVTGSEDNSIKLMARTRSSFPTHWELQCLATGTAHTMGVRALTCVNWPGNDRSTSLVVSGGGKQSVNVWQVVQTPSQQQMRLVHLASYEPLAASQDHRILGLTSFTWPTDKSQVLVLASNSEGRHRVLLVNLSQRHATKIHELESFCSSKKPILCCESLQVADKSLFITGSTDGMVTVWDLTTVLKRLATSHDEQMQQVNDALTQLTPCASFLAHDFGVNCLCVGRRLPGDEFWVLSGGDDQSLHGARLRVSSVGAESSESSVQVVESFRQRNASGSAIKAIQCNDDNVVFLAGYDQRVSVWKLVHDDDHQDDHHQVVEYQGAVFTECADIADLAVATSSSAVEAMSSSSVVVVVGQGLQQMCFQHVTTTDKKHV